MIDLYQLSENEKKQILNLSEQLTGNYPLKGTWQNLLFTNVIKRMRKFSHNSIQSYLNFAKKSAEEKPYLVTSLTIHTTSWFREKMQLELFAQLVTSEIKKKKIKKIKVMSAACSSGEEVYSLGLILEEIRERYAEFEYEIFGIDIDPISIEKSLRGIYEESQAKEIPLQYQKYILEGSNKTKGYFTIDSEIRKRCLFAAKNISKDNFIEEDNFDYIFCRNVLIYFSSYEIEKIINRYIALLNKESGYILLGQSETISASKYDLSEHGNAIYSFVKKVNSKEKEKKHVLIVDDSKTILLQLERILSNIGFITHLADSAKAATKFLQNSKVDIISLDLKMPDMNGAEWLSRQRHMGLSTPVIVISESSRLQADEFLNIMEVGGNDFIEKKHLKENILVFERKFKQLINKSEGVPNLIGFQKSINNINYQKYLNPVKAIVIGASTGGTQALAELLENLAKPCPPIFVVQHLPCHFNGIFAQRMAKISGLELGTPKEGESVKWNHIYLSHGDYHIGISFEAGLLKFKTSSESIIKYHRPSVDFLFRSAIHPNHKVLAILLTGMGKDGASALLELKNSDNMTVAQNLESSVVFGMPGEACKIGAPRFVSDLKGIRKVIDEVIGLSNEKKCA